MKHLRHYSDQRLARVGLGVSLAVILAATGFLYVVEAQSAQAPDTIETPSVRTPIEVYPITEETDTPGYELNLIC